MSFIQVAKGSKPKDFRTIAVAERIQQALARECVLCETLEYTLPATNLCKVSRAHQLKCYRVHKDGQWPPSDLGIQ